MTQPIMEEGRWAVLRNGEVTGPIEANIGLYKDTYPWRDQGRGYTATGDFFHNTTQKSQGDIIATFATYAEAEAYVRGEPVPVVSDAPAVDWEQRRWEAAKENMAALLGLSGQNDIVWIDESVRIAILAADAIIAALKGETK